ncbi:MAG: hypothetical protein SFT81_07785 [Candidatus Caenarcaniphilales bacterium]|nr:hypothetical protein [Candidatus Caenarcaniphilales bacterium]
MSRIAQFLASAPLNLQAGRIHNGAQPTSRPAQPPPANAQYGRASQTAALVGLPIGDKFTKFLSDFTKWSPVVSLLAFITGIWGIMPSFVKDWMALANEGVNITMQLFGKPYTGLIAMAADACEYIGIFGNASDELHSKGWLAALTHILSSALIFVVLPSKGIPFLFNQLPVRISPKMAKWKLKGIGFLLAMLGIGLLEMGGNFFLKKIKPPFDDLLTAFFHLKKKDKTV